MNKTITIKGHDYILNHVIFFPETENNKYGISCVEVLSNTDICLVIPSIEYCYIGNGYIFDLEYAEQLMILLMSYKYIMEDIEDTIIHNISMKNKKAILDISEDNIIICRQISDQITRETRMQIKFNTELKNKIKKII